MRLNQLYVLHFGRNEPVDTIPQDLPAGRVVKRFIGRGATVHCTETWFRNRDGELIHRRDYTTKRHVE